MCWNTITFGTVASAMIVDTNSNVWLPAATDLDLIPADEFAARWCLLVGEPPAILLEDWVEMIRLLVESTPAAAHRTTSSNDLLEPREEAVGMTEAG